MFETGVPMEQRSKADHYRGEADRVRRKSGEARDAVIRHELLGMAEQYERLAAEHEQQEDETRGAQGQRPLRRDRPSVEMRELYASPNGDKWFLARHATEKRVFVRHEANAASGGRASDIAIETFLAGQPSPERQALLNLIGTLVGGRLH